MSSKFLFLISIILSNFIVTNLSAYDDDLLNIFSKLIPRIVLLSSQKEKINTTLEICLVHNSVDENVANSLIEKTTNNYPKGIKNYQIKFIKNSYADITPCKQSSLLFLLNSNEKNIQKAINFSNQNEILTMSYDAKLLSNGVDISMFLGRSITPYINMKSIHKKKIQMNNNLLRISKIYNEEVN